MVQINLNLRGPVVRSDYLNVSSKGESSASLLSNTNRLDFSFYPLKMDRRYMVNKVGQVKGPIKILKHNINENGYHTVAIGRNNTHRVHRLVATTFGLDIIDKDINHKDGNKSNNSIYNLEACDRSYNLFHAGMMALAPVGENHVNAKLTNKKVNHIRFWLDRRFTIRSIAKAYKVTKNTISDIKKGITWKHLPY